MSNFTKALLVFLAIGFIMVILGQYAPSPKVIGSAGALLLYAVIAVAGVILIWPAIKGLGRMIRLAHRQSRREWGCVFWVPGIILMILSPGPYKHENPLEGVLLLAGIGLALLILGWGINRFPFTKVKRISPTAVRRLREDGREIT